MQKERKRERDVRRRHNALLQADGGLWGATAAKHPTPLNSGPHVTHLLLAARSLQLHHDACAGLQQLGNGAQHGSVGAVAEHHSLAVARRRRQLLQRGRLRGDVCAARIATVACNQLLQPGERQLAAMQHHQHPCGGHF